MARSFHVDVTKGISAVVNPRLLGDGYAVFIDNADLTEYSASSYRAPVYRQDLVEGTRHAFEYRGKWHFSAEHRHWAAEFVGKQERLFYTESGHIPESSKPAMKVIDGVEARLGTPRPGCAAVVTTDVIASPGNLTVAAVGVGSALPDGSVTYRLGYRTIYGLIPAGDAITIALVKGQNAVLKWTPTTLLDVVTTVIYGRTSGKEQILDEVGMDVLTFMDNGSMSPHGEYAINLDLADTFTYFHTYLRTVNNHTDESGRSPISKRIDQGRVCKITRNPELEGMFSGSAGFDGADSFKTIPTQTIVGSAFRRVGGLRVITTSTDHGLVPGAEVGVIPSLPWIDTLASEHVYKPTFFTGDLPAPTIINFGAGDTGGSVWSAGTALRARVSAFRGSGWDTLIPGGSGGVPAESLASAEVSWTTTAAKGLLQWSFPTGDADGFHVYLDDLWVATVPATVLFLEFATLTGTSGRPFPTANMSRLRCFFFPEDSNLVWDSTAGTAAGHWGMLATVVETKIERLAHGLIKGEALSFTGYKELSAVYEVSRIGTVDEFYVKVLTLSDDTTSTHRSYRQVNPAFQFVDKWALYVQRGDTGGIPLQQGIYPISQIEVIDYKPVQGLTVTCDSSYQVLTSEGQVQVDFNPPPLGLRCPTLHFGSLWGIVDNDVVWGPVNRPDAFPNAYRRSFPFPPVALAEYGGAMIVLLPNGIGRFDGTDPANMSFSMTDVRDGCIAPNSVQHTAAGLMYLSPRGLMAFQVAINSAIPITDGKIDASVFSGASSAATTVWAAWWLPTRNSAAWAKCTRHLPAASPDQRERTFDETLPQLGIQEDIRSFYWRGRYYLYFTGDTYGNHGTLVVDTSRKNESGHPIFHIGLRPTHAHVTDRDQAFVVLNQASDYFVPEYTAKNYIGAQP